MQKNSPKWIWLPEGGDGPNAYARFRTTIVADNPADDWRARVSVAGNYAMRINGATAAFGQYTDWPDAKTYTETAIGPFLRKGANALELDVWFSGNRFSSHYDGEPGLWATVLRLGSAVDVSSGAWSAALDRRYSQGGRTILFLSHNYTYDFDANRRVDDADFAPARELPDRGTPSPRPVEPSSDRGFFAGRVVAAGEGFAVYDLGEERTGLLQFTLDAAGGERLEIVHGEYLANGRLRDFSGGERAVVDAYTCRPGRQTFVHWLRRYGCRYIEFRAPEGRLARIESAGLRVTELDGLETPPFRCSDALFERMHEVSCRTLRCCLHEKYENCPWREQSICEYDARNQMLFGYALWGNYGCAAAMARLFAKSELPEGFLTAIAPSASRTVIPMFSFPWIVSVCEHCFYSGSDGLFVELAPQIERMLGKIMAWRSGGLFTIPEIKGARVWNYCEPYELDSCANPPNAFYNLYLREALLAAAGLFRAHGRGDLARDYEAEARKIADASEARFWDEAAGAYANAVDPRGRREVFSGHVQSLFLAQGLVPAARVPRVIGAIRAGKVGFQELPSLPYLVRGVFEHGTDDDREWLHAKIRQLYGAQIEAGATTWWEVHDGVAYADGGGSLCHGWSAVPAWYTARYILGVVPTSPGYRTYEVRPCALGGITSASGRVMTPRGPVEVAWHLEGGRPVVDRGLAPSPAASAS